METLKINVGEKMISLIIPAYNEEKRIHKSLAKLTKYMNEISDSYEIICVIDGTDRTGEIARSFALKNSNIKILNFKRRLGKGEAVHKGIEASKGNKIIILDSDIPVFLNSISLFSDFLDTYDIVICKRLYKYPFHRKIIRKVWNFLSNFLFPNLKISDTQGGFKGLKEKTAKMLFKNLKASGYVWDVEILLKARKNGFSIKEYPVRFFYRKGSKLNLFVDWFFMLLELLRLKILVKRKDLLF